MKKKTPEVKNENDIRVTINWDHEVAEEVRKIKAWIEASVLIVLANMILGVAGILCFILRK